MDIRHRWSLLFLLALVTPWIAGCCCCGRLPSNLNYTAPGDGDGATPVDPDASVEEKDARRYADQALAKKGYGPAKTSNLRKDDINWYVTGQTGGVNGGDAPYEIWFTVTEFKNENEIRQVWAVKSISVNNEVVFP